MAEASATSHTTSPTGVAPLAVSNQTATPATAITMAIPKVDLPKPIFSTERERQPYHNMASGPPYPLVIVRSDMRKDTADYAHFCIDKYRDQALCLFPQCGYDITDVWPDAEIQLSGIPFMKEVLKFLTFENVHRARLYARTWAEQNPLELSKLGQGNLSGFYDEKDHLAIVDKIFVKGETAQFPRPFLWHVANIIRHDILAQAAEQAATTRVSTTPGVSGGEPVGHVDSTRPATESMSKAGKAEAAAPNLAIPDRTPRGASQAPSVAMNSTPNVVPSTFPHGQHQPQPYRLAGQPTMMSPYMNAPDPRDSISRDSRQNPSSYNQPGSQPGWIENYRGAQNYGHQSRHPSGNVNVPVNQLPRMNAPISMMQAPMMHPLYPMGPYSQHPAMMPPQMPPAQTHYGVPYGLPYGPPQMGGHVETIAPMSNMHSVVGPSLRSGMPRGDTIQYPYNVQTQHTNQHAGMDRRGSYSRNPEQATLKKSGRSSFSYNGTRNRKLSNSVQNRPGFAPQNVSPVDLNVSYGGNRHADPSFTRNFSTVKPFEVDESITSDTVYGCDETWIGARNEDVKCLWICQLPKDPSETEIMAWFQEFNVVQASSVRLKQDKNHHPYGYIDFSTTDDARKALKFFNNELPQLRGKRVLVKVPEKYYSVQDSSHGQFLSGNSRPFMSASQPARPTPKADEHLPPANDSVQYSPQDARSTLAHDRVRSREAGIPLGSGSPEFPKSKKQQKTPSNKSSLEHMPVRQDSSDASVSAQEQKIEPPVPAIKDINLMDNNHMKNTGTKTSLVVEADQDKRTMEPSGGTSPENENDIVSAEQQKNFHTTEMDSTKTTASLSEKTDLPTASTQFTEPAEVPHVLSSQKKAAREKSVLEENIPEDPTQGDYAQQQDSQAPPLQRGADPLTEEMEKATVTTDAAHSLSVKPGETVPDLQVHTEAASHDEEKNDVSYHAAKETRSDPHLHDEKSDLMAYGESPTENVTTPPIRGPDAVQVSVPSAGISAMPVVTQIASQPAMQPESNNKKEKQGVQQTQFVSDFGMAKTLTKKEREARKKEKKKGPNHHRVKMTSANSLLLPKQTLRSILILSP
ncbi:hypothetical protein K504DRAFT_211005 [Pleomassaria siparia CBS 279.74]|uniref:RRM domain-containing protein n=1 Tax=Pleomassaria siparia CBS 279.74 TaxID=1314801 RepID=A0A6G1KJK0_9PLEO|nr:hypothetical protein K504DRAFT_211005 [Pleomassaria siparia CBS 279.74]